MSWSPVKVAIVNGGSDGRAAVEALVRAAEIEVGTWNEFLWALRAEDQRTLFDYETRCEVSVVDVGAYKYARDPSNEVLCVGWRSRPAKGRTFVAHNIAFEEAISQRHVPYWANHDFRWSCTASRARRLGIPGSLDGACNVMRTPNRKSADGHRVMLQVSQPRPQWVHQRKGAKYFEDAERLAATAIYCARDILAECDLDDVLPELPPHEYAIWDQIERANRRGLRLDLDLIAAMERIVGDNTREVLEEVRRLTGDDNFSLTAPQAVRDFCAKRGVFLEDLRAGTVEAVLNGHRSGARVVDPLIVKVLEGRQSVGKSSNAKLPAMRDRLEEDGYARDYAIYHGAHTGRQTGSKVNPLNMPRPYRGYDPDKVIAAIRAHDLEALDAMRVTPSLAVSASLRGCIIAPDGKQFAIGDYSSVEPCVTFTLAGQWDAVEVLRRRESVYLLLGPAVWGREISKKEVVEYTLCKALTLACFAADTRVLTKEGWKRIVDVSVCDLLWDGEQWVSHGGLICRGQRSVMNVGGLWLTHSHRVLVGSSWRAAWRLLLGRTLSRALATASANLPSLGTFCPSETDFSPSWCGARAARRSIASISTISTAGAAGVVMRALRSSLERLKRITGATRTFAPMTATDVGCLIASARSRLDAPARMRGTGTATAGAAFTSARSSRIKGFFSRTFSRYQDGITHRWNLIEPTTRRATNAATCGSLLALKTQLIGVKSLICRRKSIVYDLLSVGPRNRFVVATVVGPLIVHNCGYGQGADGFINKLKSDGVEMPEDDARRGHAAYRQRYPMIPACWKGLEEAFKAAIRNPHTPYYYGVIGFICDGYWGSMILPNGRSIMYPNTRLMPGKYNDEVTYEGRTRTGGWGDVRTWGGSILENAAQSISRDITVEDKIEVERALGWHVPLDIYDEIVAECDDSEHEPHEKLLAIMRRQRTWLPQMPVWAEGFSAKRYRKD